MKSAQKRKYHHGNLKEALIKVALDIIKNQGLTGLSLRKCAEIIDVSHTAPKNHFSNMVGLQTAIAARGYGQLEEFMRRAIAMLKRPVRHV